MERIKLYLAASSLMALGMAPGVPVAEPEDGQRYQIPVTNLTRDQQFTPILVASHRAGVNIFTLGSPASGVLATLAEEGNTAPLAAQLSSMSAVKDVVSGNGLLNPGQTVTLTVRGDGAFNRISVASMLIPTNDGFFALNSEEVPQGNAGKTFYSPAYDAGSERNDESCTSIPGPFFAECGGPGGGEEGYVHIHAGIHGIGDLDASRRDWRNPVAKIAVRKIP